MSPWLDLKTSVYGLVHKFITRRNSLTNQATYYACYVTSKLYVARIIICNVLCFSVSLRFYCYLFFLLSLLGEESPIFWISDSVRIDWYNKMNLMSDSILNANLLSVPFLRLNDRHQYLSNCHLPLP